VELEETLVELCEVEEVLVELPLPPLWPLAEELEVLLRDVDELELELWLLLDELDSSELEEDELRLLLELEELDEDEDEDELELLMELDELDEEAEALLEKHWMPHLSIKSISINSRSLSSKKPAKSFTDYYLM
jgi:regulator of replication initiation timing